MTSRVRNAREGGKKRPRESEEEDIVGKYTQGPLDEDFGSRAAFPMEGSEEVVQYLQSVRTEALNDVPISFSRSVKEKIGAPITTQEVPKVNEAFRNWADVVVGKLMEEKEKMKNTPVSDSTAYEFPETAGSWRKLIMETEPPNYGYFSCLTHSTVIKLIVYATKWLSANTSPSLSQWLFALFVRLDRPLDQTETAIVREVAKKALRIHERANGELNTTTRYSIGYVVAINALYYGQQDLLSELDAIDGEERDRETNIDEKI